MNLIEAVGGFLVAGAAIATPVLVSQAPAPKPSVNSLQSAPIITPAVAPERIKIKVSVSALEDLKVRQGDQIAKGQIIADRTRERERLIVGKRQIEASIKQIESSIIPKPPAPKKVPAVGKLPPALYIEEEAQIAAAELRERQAERELNYWRSSLNSEPAGEAAAVEKARIARDEAGKKLFDQDTKIVLVKELKNLPNSVLEHEEKILEKIKAELDEAESELRLQLGKLSDSADARKNKLQQLTIAHEQAKASVILAKSKYAKAMKDREDLEYKDSLDRIRRIEEENQSNQFYSRQVQEYEQSLQYRAFQVAQLRDRLQAIDNQLAQISNVRSPINGKIRRIKNLGQNNNIIDLELTIISGGGSSTTTDPFTSPQSESPVPETNSSTNWGD